MKIEVQTRQAEDRLAEVRKELYLAEQQLGAVNSRISQATFSFRNLDAEANKVGSKLATTYIEMEKTQAQYEKERDEKRLALGEAIKTLSKTKREFELGNRLIAEQEAILENQERGLFGAQQAKYDFGKTKVALMKLKNEYQSMVNAMDKVNADMEATQTYTNQMTLDLDTRMAYLRKAQSQLNDKEQELKRRELAIQQKEEELNINSNLGELEQ